MFKKILEPNLKPILEANYSIGEYTFGFELEAWYDENEWYGQGEVGSKFKAYWNQFNDIKLDTMLMGRDGSIRPDGMEEYESCESCGGGGRYECHRCEGSGREECRDCEGSGRSFPTCETCDGQGEIVDEETDMISCPDCDGDGHTEDECNSCEGEGTVYCSYCDGDREFDCDDCGGSGRWDSSPENTYEFKSPVMKITPLNISRVIKFLETFVEEEAISTNDTCGFHIHLGFPNQANRTKDMFWALCNLYLNKEHMEQILSFKDKDLWGWNYATKSKAAKLASNLRDLSNEVGHILSIMDAKGKTDKDDMGAYDLDVEGNMYKGYQEEFYLEAAKLNQEDEKVFKLMEKLFRQNILPFYDDDKMQIFRQHPQGTLEWRGSRAFMDDKRIEDIKDFLINKFYFLVKILNESLNKPELVIGDFKIKRNIFDKLLSTTRHVGEERVESKFSPNQDKSILGAVFSKLPILNQIYFKSCTFSMPDKNTVKIEGDGYRTKVDIKYKPLPKNVNIIFDIGNLENCIFDNPGVLAKNTSISFCKIYEGRFEDCDISNSDNRDVDDTIYHSNLIYGGTFYKKTVIKKATIFGGNFKNSTIVKSNIWGGTFENCEIEDCNVKDGTFINCTDRYNREFVFEK